MEVADQYAGQTGPCSACGKTITIPGNPYAAPVHLQPAKSGTSAGVIIAVLGVVAVVGFCGIGILVALLLPAVQAAREAARRMQSQNNIKQIVLGMQNYHDTYNSFPPAVVSDENGQPLYSGRVLLLPFMEQKPLFDQWDQSKAWDSPENIALSQTSLKVFVDPSSSTNTPGHTDYVFVTGKNTCFEGDKSISMAAITDGTANTVLILEVKGNSHSWAEPFDYDIASGPPSRGSHPGIVLVGFADGHISSIPNHAWPNIFPQIFTRNDGLPLNEDF